MSIDTASSRPPLGSELGEEPIQCGGVLPAPPHTTFLRRWSSHQGEVLVVLAPGDLVHPDVDSPSSRSGSSPRRRPGRRPAPRCASRPAQPADRGLVHPGRQPRQHVIEVAGSDGRPGGERDRLDDDTVGRARQPAQAGPDLDPPPPEIEMPPPRPHRPGVVAGRRLVTTVRAPHPPAPQHHRHHHQPGEPADSGRR